MFDDLIYFTNRANEERRLAMAAAHANARRSHLELAARYAALASMCLPVEGRTEPAQKRARQGSGLDD
jgi:hypothetical protein